MATDRNGLGWPSSEFTYACLPAGRFICGFAVAVAVSEARAADK
jgi:hypothetical protein